MTRAEKAAALVPYLRQSVKKEESISLEVQLEDVQRWAKTNGVELLPEIVEEGVSGSKHWRKRKLGEAIAACERGEAAGVVVAYQSRLSRESGVAAHELYEALDAAGARLVCVKENIDTGTGARQRMVYSILAAVAREEWESRREGWDTAKRKSVERGAYISAHVPVGYDRPQVVRDGEPVFTSAGRPVLSPLVRNADAPAVAELFRIRASGGNWGDCRRMMEAREVVNGSGTGAYWTSRAMRHVVGNRCYLGESRCGLHVNPNAHEPIVDAATFNAAQRREPATGKPPVGSLLGGLVYCSGCGRKMSPMRGGLYYQCRSTRNYAAAPCPSVASCPGPELDRLVSEAFLMLIPAHYEVGAPTADTEPLERRLVMTRNGLEALLKALETAAPEDVAAMAGAVGARRRAVEEAEGALRSAQLGTGLAKEAGTIGQRWDGMGTDERRRWLREWGFRVEVERAEKRGVPVADRATLTWSPEPLHPEAVTPATLRDLVAGWDALAAESLEEAGAALGTAEAEGVAA